MFGSNVAISPLGLFSFNFNIWSGPFVILLSRRDGSTREPQTLGWSLVVPQNASATFIIHFNNSPEATHVQNDEINFLFPEFCWWIPSQKVSSVILSSLEWFRTNKFAGQRENVSLVDSLGCRWSWMLMYSLCKISTTTFDWKLRHNVIIYSKCIQHARNDPEEFIFSANYLQNWIFQLLNKVFRVTKPVPETSILVASCYLLHDDKLAFAPRKMWNFYGKMDDFRHVRSRCRSLTMAKTKTETDSNAFMEKNGDFMRWEIESGSSGQRRARGFKYLGQFCHAIKRCVCCRI